MDPTDPRFDQLQGALQGDRDAQEHVLKAWLPVVLRWCRRLGGPLVLPEEAAVDACTTAWRRFETARDARCFEGWLFSITRKVVANHRRKAWVRAWFSPTLSNVVLRASVVSTQETTTMVHRVLERLPEEQRVVLVLVLAEGRSTEEVALLLDEPLGTVKSRLRLARARFRLLARDHGADPGLVPMDPEVTP